MKFKYMLPLIFSGLITVNSSFAANLDVFRIVGICGKISLAILNLVEKSQVMDAFCSIEANNAALFVNKAGENIMLGKYEEAILNLHSSEKKMRAVQMQPELCSSIAPFLKEFISNVVDLADELSDARIN